ncbi:hypothetical protein KPH14_007732 [Odynerus spinipes]|uniref:EndoU domain-containing protein n=1 Tax=Odynerus spinipes TaxID=1348599 RepID=A0AAD9RJ12_9HYME|nr:hypothetical protein KPH14_007732 [Odynerus spinipes]
MTWPKILFLLLLFGSLDIDYTSGGKFSFSRLGGSRSSSSHRISRPSYSTGHHSTSIHRSHTPTNIKPITTGHTGSVITSHQHNKDSTTNLLHTERGGATIPQPSINTNNKPALPPYVPSAPPLPVHETKPLFSSVPNQGSGTQFPKPSPGFKPDVYPSNNPPPIGFKPHAYPNNNPPPPGFKPEIHPGSNPGLQSSYPHNPSYPRNPTYPSNPMPPPYPSMPHPGQTAPHLNPSFPASHNYPPQPGAPHFPSMPNSHPINNPYGGYVPSGQNLPHGQTFYPQQQVQYFSQPAAQPYIPGQTTILMPNQQSSGRGFGDMIKEALVFSTINAGVNRLINPHTHYYEPRPATSDGTADSKTYITYNNHYHNFYPGNTTTGTADAPNPGFPPNQAFNPAAPNSPFNPAAPNSPPNPATMINPGSYNPSVNVPSTLNTNNMGLPNQSNTMSTSTNVLNDRNSYAQGNNANPQTSTVGNTVGIFQYPISDDDLYKISEDLFAREEHNVTKYITLNLQSRFTPGNTTGNITDVADGPLFYVQPEAYNIPSIKVIRMLYDNYERNSSKKENRTQEKRVQDWIYFDYEESFKRINYMGYVDKLNFGDKASLVKLNFNMEGITRPNTTIFVGTTPELEMSLYTICFYARPNNLCPVSLGNTKFNIYTHSFRYFGKDLIDLGLPII